MTRVVWNFVLTSKTFEPTCIRDIVVLMEGAVNIHDNTWKTGSRATCTMTPTVNPSTR